MKGSWKKRSDANPQPGWLFAESLSYSDLVFVLLSLLVVCGGSRFFFPFCVLMSFPSLQMQPCIWESVCVAACICVFLFVCACCVCSVKWFGILTVRLHLSLSPAPGSCSISVCQGFVTAQRSLVKHNFLIHLPVITIF